MRCIDICSMFVRQRNTHSKQEILKEHPLIRYCVHYNITFVSAVEFLNISCLLGSLYRHLDDMEESLI